MMKVKNGKIRCLFCDSLIKFQDGQLSRLTSHIEHEHEVSFKLDLVLAISFLSEKEIDVLTIKMKPRMEYFLGTNGDIIDDGCDIFNEEDKGKRTDMTNEMKETLVGDLGDDKTVCKDNEIDHQEKAEIVINRVVNNFEESLLDQKREETIGKCMDIIQETLLDDLEDGSDDEEEIEINEVKIEPGENLLKEELEVSGKVSSGRTYNLRYNKKDRYRVVDKEQYSVKPCNINIKKIVARTTIDLEESSYVDNDVTEDSDDLDPQQEEILQNVSCEMDIGENEVDCKSEEDSRSTSNIKEINLVEKFGINQCRLCFSEFSCNNHLRRHMENVHIDDQEALDLTFFTLKDLVNCCNMCPLGFLTENILITHKKLKHRVEVKSTTVKCSECQKVVKYNSFKTHMLTHTDDKFECNLCYKTFTMLRYLQNHQKKIHINEAEYINKMLTDDDLKFNCDICNKKFVTFNVLEYHMKSHEEMEFQNLRKSVYDEKDKKYQCKLCYLAFKSFAVLNAHITQNHQDDKALLKTTIKEKDKIHICDQCELKFVTPAVLKYHKIRAHGSKPKFVRCRTCSKVVRRDRFPRHFQSHTAERVHACQLCYMKFKFPDHVKRHQGKVHTSDEEKEFLLNGTGEFHFRCDPCNLIFLTDKLLQSHIRKHASDTSERVHACQLCYMKFKLPDHVKRHQGKVHTSDEEREFLQNGTGEFQFRCDPCNLNYLTDKLLQSHMRKHASEQFEHLRKESYDPLEKRFKCKLCYLKYSDFRYLAGHFESIHREETEILLREIDTSELVYNCEECDIKFVTQTSLDCHNSKMHHLDASSKHCRLCDLNYKTTNGFWKHKLNIHKLEMAAFEREYEENDKIFGCNSCDKKYVTEISLNYHISNRHHKLKKKLKAKSDNLEKYCKLCDISYKTSGGFKLHKFKIHKLEMDAFKTVYEEKDMIFGCNACKKKYVTQISLNHHISKRHYKMKRKIKVKVENQEKYCQLCYIVYKDPKFLRKHKKKIHVQEMDAFDKELSQEDMKHLCTKCNRSFYSQNTLEYHMHRKHNKGNSRNEVSCKLCYVTYSRSDGLKKHMEVKHKDDMHFLEGNLDESLFEHICQTCDRRFIKEDFLRYHQKYEHREHQETQSYCKLCYLPFKFPSLFKKHQANIHKDDLWAFKVELDPKMLQQDCPHCDLKFLSEQLLNNHITYQHKELKEKVSYCRLCYVDFKFNSNLKAHKSKIHTTREEVEAFSVKMEVSSLPFGCKFCKKRFLTENIQKYHNIHSHKEEKRQDLTCRLCYIDFKFNSNLEAHKSKIHTTREEIEAFSVKMEVSSLHFGCKFCKKRFLTENIQKYHNIHSHKEEKRQDLTCEYCNKVFVWKDNRKRVMENHMRIKHNLDSFNVDDQEPGRKENDSVQSFMRILNSLK